MESRIKPSRDGIVTILHKEKDFVFLPAARCPLESLPREQIVDAQQFRPARQSGAVVAHGLEIPP
ncbi:MAG TPA: hypothetical protein VEO37_10225, partial [Thermoanaerobaculia bacterium]|nr:hypothetical protein [Thermoanaerobaculia bacterium]